MKMKQRKKIAKGKVRGTLYFRGDVQNIGFRGLALRTGRSLELTGLIVNLDDGRVRIICEGPKDRILELARQLKMADDVMHVAKVTKRFSKASGEFKGFKVKFEELGQEMFQGFETAAMYLSKVRDEVKDVSKVVKEVGQEVGSMRDDMNVRFDKLDEKYDVIGTSLIKTNQNLERMNENIANLVETTSENNAKMNENIANLVETTSENNAKMNENIANLVETTSENIAKMNEVLISHTDALTRLVATHVEREANGQDRT